MEENNFNFQKENQGYKSSSHKYKIPRSIKNIQISQIDENITEKRNITNQSMKDNDFNSPNEGENINCYKSKKVRCIKNKKDFSEISENTEIDDSISEKQKTANQNIEDNNFNSPKEIQREILKRHINSRHHSIKNKTKNTEIDDNISEKEKNYKNEITNDVIKYKRKKPRDISNFNCKRELKKKLPLILLILVFLGIISLMIYLIIKLLFKKNNKIGKNYPEEVLITNINYIENLIFKFHSKKIINLKGESRDKLDDKNSHKISIY